MAKPNNSMKTIQTPDGTDHEIVPEKLGSGSYYADLDTLSADGKILSVTPITASSFTIQGQSVGLYRTTQTTTLFGKNSSDLLISNVYTNSIIKISRIESGTTYWTLYGDDYVTALVEGTTTSSSSTMFTTSADTQTIKNAYLKNASVSGDTVTITKQDNSTVTFTVGGGGGGGSVSIDNTSITENSSNQIQTVGVIDQKTGNANKQWTGTLQEYNALGTHDANTFYNITDDTASGRILVKDITISTSTTFYNIEGLDILADGGRYDIEITSPIVSGSNTNFWFRLNNKSGGADYVHSYWFHQGGLNAGSQSLGSSAYIGTIAGDVCWTNGYIILGKANSVPYWEWTNIGYNTSLFYEKFYGYTITSSNITSLQLISSNVTLNGMHIKIYKRSSV